MARQLNVILDDEDHQKLLKAKGQRSWREFIMTLVGVESGPPRQGYRTIPLVLPPAHDGEGAYLRAQRERLHRHDHSWRTREAHPARRRRRDLSDGHERE